MNETRPAPGAKPPAVAPGSPHPRPRRRGAAMLVAVVLVLVLGTVWWINHRQEGARPVRGRFGFRGDQNAPLPVAVHAVEKADIPIYLNALGTVTPAHVATIRTQITGQLQQIAFDEGQLVHQGDLLAVIDPRPYENALAQAQAQLLQAESQLRVAQLNLSRYETLAKEDSIARQQVDTTRSQVSQYHGLVQAAQAAIATANLNLTYCHIRAPFDGRVGLRQVDPGNYVTPGDANGIVVLSQTKPITVIFTLPENYIAEVSRRLNSGAKLVADAYDPSGSTLTASGTLTSIDNQIDPSTGTFKLRAEFTNEKELLFPNQFVNIRLHVATIRGATVVPSSAIERGQSGPYVYVVTPGKTAVARTVAVGHSEAQIVAVTSGLKVGELVVVDGADKLKDGQKVILQAPGNGAPAAAATGRPVAPNGRQGASGDWRHRGNGSAPSR